MPRKRMTQSGAPAMSIQQIPGQEYGAGVEQQALQRAMPSPQAQPVGAVAAPQSPSTPTATQSASAAPAPSDPMAAAAAFRGRADLFGPSTTRPDEPVTHGLSRGPGAGPEVMGGTMASPLGDTLRKLAAATGDSFFLDLAQKARL